MEPDRTKPIGLLSLICLVIGNMIGAGVYISSCFALRAIGDARLVLMVWIIGGLHACCGAIAYAALAKRVQISGGEYAFLSRYIHPAAGFIAGWISLVAGFTAPIAAAALVFGEYVCESPQASTWSRSIATALVIAGAVFHSVNLRTASWINNAIVGLKFLGFAIFIAACLYHLSDHSYSGVLRPTEATAKDASLENGESRIMAPSETLVAQLAKPGMAMLMLVQLFYVSLAYTGFNASIYIAGELEHSVRNKRMIARSMILAAAIVTLVYLALNYLFLYSSPPEIVANGFDYFVSDVAYYVGGNWLKWTMRITIALSSATSVLAMLATGPRVYVQMSRDGTLPKFFSTAADVPRFAIWVQAALSSAIVWFATVRQLLEYLGLTLTACGALAVSSLWIAYSKFHDLEEVRWFEHLALAIYLAGAIALLTAAAMEKPIQFWFCLGTFASGFVVFLAMRSRRTHSSKNK